MWWPRESRPKNKPPGCTPWVATKPRDISSTGRCRPRTFPNSWPCSVRENPARDAGLLAGGGQRRPTQPNRGSKAACARIELQLDLPFARGRHESLVSQYGHLQALAVGTCDDQLPRVGVQMRLGRLDDLLEFLRRRHGDLAVEPRAGERVVERRVQLMRRNRQILLEIEIEVGQGHRIGDRAALAHRNRKTRADEAECLRRDTAAGRLVGGKGKRV